MDKLYLKLRIPKLPRPKHPAGLPHLRALPIGNSTMEHVNHEQGRMGKKAANHPAEDVMLHLGQFRTESLFKLFGIVNSSMVYSWGRRAYMPLSPEIFCIPYPQTSTVVKLQTTRAACPAKSATV